MIMHAEARRFEMTAPRLTPFEVGQIVALHRKGYAYRIISESIIRSDPEAPAPSFGAIGQAIRRWEADPSWTGERARGSGRPRKTTATADARIVESVKKWRGKRKMTSTMLRRMEPAAKTVSPRTLRRRLNEAELHWFRRRRKTLVPELEVESDVPEANSGEDVAMRVKQRISSGNYIGEHWVCMPRAQLPRVWWAW